MTGMSNYTANNFLDTIVGRSSYTSPTGVYLALFNAVGTDVGTGFTEVSGTGYARANASGSTYWGAATGTAPATITNSASGIAFPQATASWGTVVAWGLYDYSGVSAGNLLFWDFLGNDPWFPFTSISGAASGVFTAIGITAGSSPNLANGSSIVFTNEYGGTLPTSITEYTVYTVSGLTNDVFYAANPTAVSASTTAAGMVRQITQQSIPANVTASFNTSNLTLTAA